MIDQIFASARTAYRSGDLATAERRCQEVLRLAPGHLPTKSILGMVAGQTGRRAMAISLLQEVVTNEPGAWGPMNALAIMLRETGAVEAAIEVRRRALLLKPEDPNGHYDLGLGLMALGRRSEAVEAYEAAVLLDPNAVHALAGLAEGKAAMGMMDQATELRRKAYEAGPDTLIGSLEMAYLLVDEQRVEEAERFARRAVEIDPTGVEARATLGRILQRMGRFSEAEIVLQRALEDEPVSGKLFWLVVGGRRIEEKDRPVLDRMDDLLRSQSLGLEDRMYIHFGLGKAFDDLKEYEDAIWQYDGANRCAELLLRNSGPPFDPQEYRDSIDRVIETYPAGPVNGTHAASAGGTVPIFIVGMMRSGTTLVEQILSSHPDVARGDEIPFWTARHKVYGSLVQQKLGDDAKEHVAGEYLDLLRKRAPGVSRVTDKSPENYLALGLVLDCLPGARIIHCRRHPVDTCLSIFMTSDCHTSYGHNRGNIVFAYEQYVRLMDHWRAVLPPDRFLEIDYETLVADQEGQTRRIISFCGLRWENECLHHERNEAPISTPSNWQARQPIYKTSTDRWRNYEPWLGSFKALFSLTAPTDTA